MTRQLTVALPKGRLGKDALSQLKTNNYASMINLKSRKLIFEDNNIRYLIVKPSDVLTYVTQGVADVGIIGSDTILEEQAEVYELLDLGFGKCKFSIASPKGKTLPSANETLKVATKYPKIAAEYFKQKKQKIELIKLNGSVEIAPLVGLSDVIVDIVETGNTLKANNLEVIEDMLDISAKFIANKVSYRFKYESIQAMRKALEEKGETDA